MSGAPEQRDWNLPKDQNPNREKARAVRARQRAIGRELRRMYDDIAQEPVPDDFLDLPNMASDSCLHRGRHPERLMDAREVVVHEVQGDGGLVVVHLL